MASPCSSSPTIGGPVRKCKFTQEEDTLLKNLVQKYGTRNWKTISQEMATRNPRQCRERWKNYLSPIVNHKEWTPEEDALLMKKYCEIGPKWNVIALMFDGRSVNNIRNRWVKLVRKGNKNSPSKKEEKALFDELLFPDTIVKGFNLFATTNNEELSIFPFLLTD